MREYLKRHPNASLQEYVDYVDRSAKELKDKRSQNRRNMLNWFLEKDNKYFVLKIGNGGVYSIFKFICPTSPEYIEKYDSYKMPIYYININDNETAIRFSKNGTILKNWMGCPYLEFNNNNGYELHEITEEQYNQVVEFAEQVNNNLIKFTNFIKENNE